MNDEQEREETQETDTEEALEINTEEESPEESENLDEFNKSIAEANDKYLRLYADFENYKKIAARNKEELLKYANEELISEILTVIDHLELALQHSTESDASNALAEGVNLTLKELRNVLEKHGLISIDALGKPFDPSVHHAMSQVEAEGTDDNTVVKEFRKGYMLKSRLLRAALVAVSKKETESEDKESDNDEEDAVTTDKKKKT
jgi:molecular chaperone GrpE